MEALINSAVDPIVMINPSGIICLANPSCCKTFGYHEDELKGKKVNILMPEPHATRHDNYLKNYLSTGEKKVMGTGRKLKAKRRDGSLFSIHLSLSEAIIDGERFFTGIMRDISREEEERENLEVVINSAIDPIVVMDTSGVMQRVNPACSRIFGYTQEEMTGRNVTMLMHHKHAVAHGQYLERYLELEGRKISGCCGKSHVVGSGRDVVGKRKDGSSVPIFLSVSECIMKSSGKHTFIGIMRDMSEKEKAIQAEIENKKSEALLMDILPGAISKRLKETDEDAHIADHFESVTILFADVVGFTEFSSTRSPMEVVMFLNRVFRSFDTLVDKYKLEKIKTIGDAYMVVSGLNHEQNHTYTMLHFAIDMMKEIKKYNYKQETGSHQLGIRVGINAGSVVAGVVGSKRRFFDLWGDSVNVSSRMESTGVSNCIHCTEAVANVARQYPDKFIVIDRGFIDVKGKGEIQTFLIGEKGTENDISGNLRRHSIKEYEKKIVLHRRLSDQLNLKTFDLNKYPSLLDDDSQEHPVAVPKITANRAA